MGNHMISSAIWNKQEQVNFFKDDQNCMSPQGKCNLQFTRAHLFQIAREKSFDYLFMMYVKKIEMVKQKKRTGIMQSGKSCAINCTTQDTRLI